MSSETTAMRPPNLTLIVAATSKNLGIGKNGGLPWRLKAEMQYFARVTTRLPAKHASRPKGEVQNAVIMGRKTWESIPKKFRPLKDRLNVVLSSAADESQGLKLVDGAIWVKSLESATKTLETLMAKQKDVTSGGTPEIARAFIIGGAGVYRQALELDSGVTNKVLLTKVHTDVDCDTFFPVAFDSESGWRRCSNGELSDYVGEEVEAGSIKEGTTEFEYCLYERR